MTDTIEVLRKAHTIIADLYNHTEVGDSAQLLATLNAIDEALATPAAADGEPVAWRHSHTHCLYETEEEVQLADGDEWAEPLYLAATPSAVAAQWQPIETAPKDGTAVLVADANALTPGALVAHWNGEWRCDRAEAWEDTEDPLGHLGTINPTHWMPLPPAPSTTPGKSGQEGGGA